jgi:polyphenol oxidase
MPMHSSRDPEQAWVAPAVDAWPAGASALTTTRDAAGDPRELFPLSVDQVHRLQALRQVHGSRCIEARAAGPAQPPEADALWTRERRLGVMVVTADCVPVVLSDAAATVVGVAHGGWRGLVGGVIDSLVGAMPVQPESLVAWLGPAIGPQAYEVGDDVVAAVAALPDGAALIRDCAHSGKRPGKYQLDLFALSERLLRRAGEETVLCERLCTYSDDRFHSYRRERGSGRMATLAWLR